MQGTFGAGDGAALYLFIRSRGGHVLHVHCPGLDHIDGVGDDRCGEPGGHPADNVGGRLGRIERRHPHELASPNILVRREHACTLNALRDNHACGVISTVARPQTRPAGHRT